jgi:hypothetical protein
MMKFIDKIKRLGLLLALFASLKISAEPLNVRNLNPCNIKHARSNKWLGSIRQTGTFEVFGTQYEGLRACTMVVMANIRATNSVKEFVMRFASEPEEKATDKHLANYIRSLEDTLGYKHKIRFLDVPVVVRTIIKMEGGAKASEFYKDSLTKDL